MNAEQPNETPKAVVATLDYRSALAWVLMVMFIVLPPIGTGMILGATGAGVLGSIGWGILTLGCTSGIAGYILGRE